MQYEKLKFLKQKEAKTIGVGRDNPKEVHGVKGEKLKDATISDEWRINI